MWHLLSHLYLLEVNIGRLCISPLSRTCSARCFTQKLFCLAVLPRTTFHFLGYRTTFCALCWYSFWRCSPPLPFGLCRLVPKWDISSRVQRSVAFSSLIIDPVDRESLDHRRLLCPVARFPISCRVTEMIFRRQGKTYDFGHEKNAILTELSNASSLLVNHHAPTHSWRGLIFAAIIARAKACFDKPGFCVPSVYSSANFLPPVN